MNLAHGVSRGLESIDNDQPRRGERTSAAPTGLSRAFRLPSHGLRRGLLSVVASRLKAGAICCFVLLAAARAAFADPAGTSFKFDFSPKPAADRIQVLPATIYS